MCKFEWRHQYIYTILTQDIRLINVHNELYEKFPDIEYIQQTDEEYLQYFQTKIDECKEDLCKYMRNLTTSPVRCPLQIQQLIRLEPPILDRWTQ